jgi:hypothetical protein
MVMKNKNVTIRDKDYDADCLQHLDEALLAEELAHTDYLD